MRFGVCSCHHDLRGQIAAKKAQARVLAKTQQIVVNFRIRDGAELLDIIANFHGFCAHICMDKIQSANWDIWDP